jgi:hypothetical protein
MIHSGHAKPSLGVERIHQHPQRTIKDHAETVSVEELGNARVSTLLLVALMKCHADGSERAQRGTIKKMQRCPSSCRCAKIQ